MNLHEELILHDCPYCGGAGLLEEERRQMEAGLADEPEKSAEDGEDANGGNDGATLLPEPGAGQNGLQALSRGSF